MAKKKASSEVLEPFWMFPHVHVYYELEHDKNTIKPGDKVKIKHVRGDFTFIKWVHNSNKDVTWIDCMDPKTGEFRSFHMHNLKGIVKPKRSRRKKPNV